MRSAEPKVTTATPVHGTCIEVLMAQKPKRERENFVLVTNSDYFKLRSALGGTGWDISLTPHRVSPAASHLE